MNFQRAVSVSRFVLVLLCIALLLSVAVFGYDIGDRSMSGIFEEGTIRLGLDLAGGSVITYQAQTEDRGAALTAGMQSILQVMRMRLDNLGFTEGQVYLVGDDMITVEIPSVTNPAEAAETLMATAVLTFRNADGEIVLEGGDVKSAKKAFEPIDDTGMHKHHVQLELTSSGSAKFAAATKAAANETTASRQVIHIYMDDVLISSPSVSTDANIRSRGITGGKAIISGSFDENSASVLAGQINAGALKYSLEDVDQRTVGATLGEKSLSTSLKAGAIGILLVMLFMIIFYRVQGIVASISLVAYMSLFMLALVITQANLTLPGIAGIILSIGMAVDANVVIFERTKEEFRLGKSAKAAVKGGYSNALSAVMDSNITTIIAAGVLYFLGSGTIKGFATTLLIGVVISLFTAIFLTRLLLNLFIGIGASSAKLFGVKEKSKQFLKNFHFINNKKITVIIISVALVVGIGSFIVRGFNFDIDFSGGTELQLNIGQAVTDEDTDKINQIISEHELLGPRYVSSTRASSADRNVVIIRTGTADLSLEQQKALTEALTESFPDANFKDSNYTSISPVIGDMLRKTAMLAVTFAVILMLAYIWIRFELKSGLAAIVCLVHDLFIMLTIYSLFQIPINSTIIAAFLTILGYSINATIVVFDRVRENKAKLGDTKSFEDTVDVSVHQTLTRSFNTTLTTLFTIGMIFIFGVESIRNFALPLIIGIVSGLFSSVFLSGLLWVQAAKLLKGKEKARIKAK